MTKTKKINSRRTSPCVVELGEWGESTVVAMEQGALGKLIIGGKIRERIISCRASFEFPSGYEISNTNSRFVIPPCTCFTDIKPARGSVVRGA